jgi:hypothetical protein
VRNFGAIYGQGIGHHGNSYAIPTKDEHIKTLSLERIKPFVDEFIQYARSNPDFKFHVTKIGCGLAGYSVSDIAPMFIEAPPNCELPEEFVAYNRV